MKEIVSVFFDAYKIAFKSKKYVIGLLLLSIAIFGVFIYIPVSTIPGNDLPFQLSIMPLRDFILLTILSFLTSLSILFNLYILKKQSSIQINQLGNMTFLGAISTSTSIFGSVTCIACASTFLSFLGIGTIVFIFKYQTILVVFSILLMLISLYFTSRKVLGICNPCSIKDKPYAVKT